MYSRSYPEKPIRDQMKNESVLPDNYSGTMMRSEIPENEKTEPCEPVCEQPKPCTPEKKGGLFGGDNDELLLLAMLFLFSDKGKERGEGDLMPLLAMLFVSGIL